MEISGIYKIINNELKKFGKAPCGSPLWRLVWSNNEYEKRLGTFEDSYGSIFLRRVTEVRETRKYNYIDQRWILEKWFRVSNPELPDTLHKGSWEPIYVFESKSGEYLQPTLKTALFMVEQYNYHANNRVLPGARRAQIADEMQRRDDKELQDFMDSIDVSEITNALALREGVSMHIGERK